MQKVDGAGSKGEEQTLKQQITDNSHGATRLSEI